MSNNNFFDTSDEEAVDLIYNSCTKNVIGYLKTSDLIGYLQNSTPSINDNITNDLQKHFDPFNNDPEIDCFAFRKLMFSWIQSVREHQSYQPLHSPEKKNYNSIKVTYDSHYDTFDDSSVLTPPDHVDIKELRERMGVVEENNRRLLEEKDAIVTMADDFAQQQNSDLEAVIKRQKSELDELRQEVRELEGGRGRLQVVQTDNDELEVVVNNLETKLEQHKTHIASLQTKLEQEERRQEEGQEALQKAKKEVTEITEEKLKCEKSRDMYKTLYSEKSGELKLHEEKIETLNMNIETMKKEMGEMQMRLDECAAEKRFNLDISGSDCLDSSLLHIASPHPPITIVSNKILNNSTATHLPKRTPFKNTPNSLCSELRHSLLASSAFPSPLRDKELEEMLHDENDGEEENGGKGEGDDNDGDGNDDDDDEKDPSPPQYLVRLDEKRVEMMRKLNHLVLVALEERGKGGWTESGRQDEEEEVAGGKGNGGVMNWGEGKKTDALRKHITDEVVATINAKLDAEFNYIQLKSKFSQQISSFESQQASMREMIRDLEEEVRNKEEEFVLERSELTREMVALRHSREKWVDKNGDLRTKVGELNNKVNDLEVTIETLDARKIDLESLVVKLESELKLKGEDEEVLRGVLEEKEENIETLHRCIEKLNVQVDTPVFRKSSNKPINPTVRALEWKEKLQPACNCHMRLSERSMGEYGQGDARSYLIQHAVGTTQLGWVSRIMLMTLFLSLLYHAFHHFVNNPSITYQYPENPPI